MDIDTSSAECFQKAAEAIRDIIVDLGIGAKAVTLSIHPTSLSMDLHGVLSLAAVSALPGAIRQSYTTDEGRPFQTATAEVGGDITVTGYGK